MPQVIGSLGTSGAGTSHPRPIKPSNLTRFLKRWPGQVSGQGSSCFGPCPCLYLERSIFLPTEISMQQNINVLVAALGRSCPGGKIAIRAVGPIAIKNGEVQTVGKVTETDVDLPDVQRQESPAPVEQLQAAEAHALAKSSRWATRERGKRK
jgi:hypothetical protein